MIAGVLAGKACDYWSHREERARERKEREMEQLIESRRKELSGGGWSKSKSSAEEAPALEWPDDIEIKEFSWEKFAKE